MGNTAYDPNLNKKFSQITIISKGHLENVEKNCEKANNPRSNVKRT